jgi:hypothetical protein
LNIHGANFVLFADNINVLNTDIDVDALQNKADQVIIDLESWLQRNYLIINVGKIVIMSLHSQQISVQ